MEEKSKNFGDKVSDSFKQGTKPKFLGGQTEGGEAPAGLKANDKKSAAAAELNSSENHAAGMGLDQAEDNVSGTRESEEQAGGLYSGSGKSEAKSDGKKKGIKGKVIKGGPIAAILVAVLGVGGIMGGAQMFQPFSLVAQFTESFNSMHTSANMRSSRFFEMQMKNDRKNPIKGKIFGADTFKITDSQAAKLKAQGIEYDNNYEGVRVLKYTDNDGNLRIITADPKTTADLKAKGIENVIDFKSYYDDNIDFFNKYNAGSMTWRGAIANWFGTLTEKFFKNNNLTRNMFSDFQKKVADNGGSTKVATQEIISKRTDEIGGGGFESKEGINKRDGENENGDPVYKDSNAGDINPSAQNDGTYKASGEPVKAIDTKVSRKVLDVSAKLNDIAGQVQRGANIACTVSNIIGAVTLLVTAAEALQIINLTTAYFEAVDKTKAGYGDDAPIHDLTNALNQTQTDKNATLAYTDYSGNRDSSDNITEDGIKALTTEYKESSGSAMQSEGIKALYNGGKVNPNDPSVSSFNFTNSIKRILGGVGVSMAGFETCAIAKMVTNGVSAATDAVSIITCIAGAIASPFTFGASAVAGCSGLIGKKLAGIALSVTIGVAVMAVIATITPIVANMLTRDLVSNLGGVDLGNALTSGANMYLGNTHRANGGSLSTLDKYTEFAMFEQQVIAEKAKYERSTLSPFDITSKYTFMGAFLTQMMSFLTTSSLMNVITTSKTAVTSSIAAISPTAMAYNIEESLPSKEEYNDTCPYLASIGVIGDAYCNPYSITDVSTMSMDPSDVIDELDKRNNFLEDETSDGNVKINGKSDLAKYILYCDNRESAFGITDSNIVSAVSDWGNVNTESSTFNTAANSAIGTVPILGDIIDVGSNAQALANIGYVSGESCVAGNEVQNVTQEGEDAEWNDSDSPTWSIAKYYQRFIEDQSLAESMGLIEKSAVSIFLDEYYEQNPLDNSYEGILARKSGLSKDTVVAVLDLVEYGNYIANYHPEERYAFGAPAVEVKENLNFENEYRLASAPILVNEIIYADVRNRSFAV